MRDRRCKGASVCSTNLLNSQVQIIARPERSHLRFLERKGLTLTYFNGKYSFCGKLRARSYIRSVILLFTLTSRISIGSTYGQQMGVANQCNWYPILYIIVFLGNEKKTVVHFICSLRSYDPVIKFIKEINGTYFFNITTSVVCPPPKMDCRDYLTVSAKKKKVDDSFLGRFALCVFVNNVPIIIKKLFYIDIFTCSYIFQNYTEHERYQYDLAGLHNSVNNWEVILNNGSKIMFNFCDTLNYVPFIPCTGYCYLHYYYCIVLQ